MAYDYATLTDVAGAHGYAPTTIERSTGTGTAWPDGACPTASMSWGEIVEHARAPVCTPAFNRQHASHRKGQGGFNSLPDWNANTKAIAEGWSEGLKHIETPLARATGLVRARPIPRDRLDVGGERPSIPHAVAGDPRSMWRRAPMANRVRPVVRITFNIGAPWFIDTATIINRGAAVVAWCDSLEAAGYSTEIESVFRTAQPPVKAMEVRVNLKSAGEKFDLDRMAYTLVCPDYMRRTHFALLEECKELGEFSSGYGVPQDVDPAKVAGAYLPVIRFNQHYATPEVAVESVRTVLLGTYSNLAL